jgi:RNA polymerase sigma factor (sigma-70 family)
MSDSIDSVFIQQINQNIGIAHKICRLYFRVADDHDDALQEMMYQLWRSYSSFDKRSKFSTWMYSVCLNTALTYKRKSTKQMNETISREHYQIENPPNENKDQLINTMLEIVATLSPLNKAIVLLYLEDMSYEEIAAITGLTKSNVSVKLMRIKKELEIEMQKKVNSIEDVNP